MNENINCSACGNDPQIAALQEVLLLTSKALSAVTSNLRQHGGIVPKEANRLVRMNLAITVTSTNFDPERLESNIEKTLALKEELLPQVEDTRLLPRPALWTKQDFDQLKKEESTSAAFHSADEDLESMRQLIISGLRGIAATCCQAKRLGYTDEKIDAFLQTALALMLFDHLSGEDLVGLAMETGRIGIMAMELLDKANTGSFGSPEVSKVDLNAALKPGILISGRDMKDLELLLEQTKDAGIDIYTHGEMLAANYYPKFKEYPHLKGNYGNAWWQQESEFEKFNGPVLVTGGARLIPPKGSYTDRLYTTGAVGCAGVTHIGMDEKGKKDFSALIEQAKTCEPPEELERKAIVGGFGHTQLFAMSEKIMTGIETGAIKRFVVIAGNDGPSPTRSYYTELARSLPMDYLILTAGSIKYRFIKEDLGNIGGIPRAADAGQCSDFYSLIMMCMKLQDMFFKEDINELPLTWNIARYDETGIMTLLSLLYLGAKDIHLGPAMPDFLSPGITELLTKQFGITVIRSAESDMKEMFGADAAHAVKNTDLPGSSPSEKVVHDMYAEADAAAAGDTATGTANGTNNTPNDKPPITGDMLIGDLLRIYPDSAGTLMGIGMHCLGCPSSQGESIAQACMVHGVNMESVIQKLKEDNHVE